MFKNYLKVFPVSVQLLIFFTLWSSLMLIYAYLQPMIIQSMIGLSSDEYATFLKEDIFNYPEVLMWSNFFYQIIVFLLPSLAFAYLAHPKMFTYLGFKKKFSTSNWTWIILIAFALILAVGNLASWIKMLDLGDTANALTNQREAVFKAYLSNSSWSGLMLNLLIMALLPAVCEELVFRSILFRFANSWLKRPLLSIGLTAAIFAAFHSSLHEIIPIFLAGFLLGWIYYRTGNIWYSIVLHFLHNGIQVLLIYFSQSNVVKVTNDFSSIQSIISVFSFIISVLILLLATQKIKRINIQYSLPNDFTVEEKK